MTRRLTRALTRRTDSGAATTAAVACLGLLLLVGLTLGEVGAWFAAHRQARAAADLAALAGAGALAAATGHDPCATAGDVAHVGLEVLLGASLRLDGALRHAVAAGEHDQARVAVTARGRATSRDDGIRSAVHDRPGCGGRAPNGSLTGLGRGGDRFREMTSYRQ